MGRISKMDQLSIFDITLPTYKINNKVRLIELFAGVGSQAMALKRLGVDFETYKVVEFDEHAINSYNAIHGTDFEPTDITKITAKDLEIVDTDLLTYLLTVFLVKTCLSLVNNAEWLKAITLGAVYYGK